MPSVRISDTDTAATDAAIVDAVAALRAHGHAVVRDLFAPALLSRLAAQAQSAASSARLRPAGVGASARRAPALRGDSIAWLEPAASAAEADFLTVCERLRERLNRELLLGLTGFEAHFALYPPGAAYARHRDRLRDGDARVLSLACYLDADWSAADGGQLRLYADDGVLDVLPCRGTCVLFLSAATEHEVLPPRRPRHSIAAWFRQRRLPGAR